MVGNEIDVWIPRNLNPFDPQNWKNRQQLLFTLPTKPPHLCSTPPPELPPPSHRNSPQATAAPRLHRDSASDSLCIVLPSVSKGNGTVDNHISGNTYGSICSSNDGKASLAVAGEMAIASESLNDSGRYVHEGSGVDSLRSSQREAALTKFRLKIDALRRRRRWLK